MLRAGDTLGNYHIAAHLTGGGMAAIYVGSRKGDTNVTPIAIKVIHPHLSEEREAIRMFIDEAALSVRIRHPNVVRVDELGEESGVYYLAMEYVHGVTLAKLLGKMGLASRRLAPEMATFIAAEVAAGLHAAHETLDDSGEKLNVIHRDVSPQNILLSHQGRVKLVDFGIAKSAGRGAEHTRAGVIKGKFRYLAPEQAFSQHLDHRVDVYAMGVVLWEMLTMRRMWGNLDAIQLIGKIREAQVVPPSEFTPSIPKDLEAVVMRALARSPNDRFRSAAEMRQALLACRQGSVSYSDLSDVLKGFVAEELRKTAKKLPKPIARASGVPSNMLLSSAFMDSDTADSTTLWTRTAERATISPLDAIDPAAMASDADEFPDDPTAVQPQVAPPSVARPIVGASGAFIVGKPLSAERSAASTLEISQDDFEAYQREQRAKIESARVRNDAPVAPPALGAMEREGFSHPPQEPVKEEPAWKGLLTLLMLAIIAFGIGGGAALLLLN